MRIVHVCLNGPYTEGFGYQENLLTKYHKHLGHEVIILANDCKWITFGQMRCSRVKENYTNENGIQVRRLIPVFGTLGRKLGIYSGFFRMLKELRPDVIFFHGPQSLSILSAVKYKKKINPRAFILVDNHADWTNSARNFFSRNVLHKGIWRFVIKMAEPYVEKFYGVLPLRCDFLRQVYKISESKIELLLMGADDEELILDKERRNQIRKEIREKLKVEQSDFLVITGGKIDKFKWQTLLLMKAVTKLEELPLKLVIFGTVDKELKTEFDKLLNSDRIIYIGWLNQKQIYEYLVASDFAVFPGRHSVLWEQVVALGIPAAYKYIPGHQHVDLGGNCVFLYEDSEEEIVNVLRKVVTDKALYQGMLEVAMKNGPNVFSYSKIAERSLKVFT